MSPHVSFSHINVLFKVLVFMCSCSFKVCMIPSLSLISARDTMPLQIFSGDVSLALSRFTA